MRKIITTSAAMWLGWACSTSLIAQTMTEERTEDRPIRYDYGIEVNPLLLLTTPFGAGGVEVGGEMLGRDNLALTVNAAYYSVNLPNWVEEEIAEDDLNPEQIDAYSAGVGFRYYTDPHYSSWYAGPQVSYGRLLGTWEYKDAKVEQEADYLTPTVAAGYRWLLGKGVLLRLGAEAGYNFELADSKDVSGDAEDGEEAKDELEDAEAINVAGNIDFGIGYVF